jgi:hypothetical protein
MTGRTFRRQVIGVSFLVILLSAIAIGASYRFCEYRDRLRLAPTILIPVGAAWLAYCWQRRITFTKALFDVWQKTVITIQDAIQYTWLDLPTQLDYSEVTHSLSCRIDDIRGAFRNVGESRVNIGDKTRKYILDIKHSKDLAECAIHTRAYQEYQESNKAKAGLYPFESLKQINFAVRSSVWFRAPLRCCPQPSMCWPASAASAAIA